MSSGGLDVEHLRWLLVAAAGLEGVGPSAVASLARHPDPVGVWCAVASHGAYPGPRSTWPVPLGGGREAGTAEAERRRTRRRQASAVSLDGLARRYGAAGVKVVMSGEVGYPLQLEDHPDAPPLLFVQGSVWPPPQPAVAVVGTRRCTSYGREVARSLGRELSRCGVSVVSGLATGIDAAAHAGALEVSGAPPVAVVGTGLDIIYPRSNAALWAGVRQAGVLVGEVPLGTPSAPWRFPSRNRIIAGLAHAVVVVESGQAGGSMHTVREALARDRTVLAVPGNVTSPASTGTNQLLAEGAIPCRDTTDVLVALGSACPSGAVSPAGRSEGSPPMSMSTPAASLWRELAGSAATFDELTGRSGLPLQDVAAAVAELVTAGLVVVEQGTVVVRGRG